nr:hypothetical protein BaRGS_017175 [Batillaria attramentaria]
MNEKPYHNEPGFERERNPGDAARYNEIIRHETLRVAVCDMLESKSSCAACPDALTIRSVSVEVVFDYQSILARLQRLKEQLSTCVSDSSDLDDLSDSENEAPANKS